MGTKVAELEKEISVDANKESFIQSEINSDDPFVKVLYRDLEDRLQQYETEGSGMEKLKLSDLKAEFIMALAITGFLISVII